MFRTLLIATALLTASGSALAHDDRVYGRVVHVEPSISVSFGSGRHDGFRVLYESGGTRYWTYSPYYPGHTIVVPHHHTVQHVYHYRDHRRDWDDRRDWHDGRRGHHHKHRHHGRD